jgi:hypothetical protein
MQRQESSALYPGFENFWYLRVGDAQELQRILRVLAYWVFPREDLGWRFYDLQLTAAYQEPARLTVGPLTASMKLSVTQNKFFLEKPWLGFVHAFLETYRPYGCHSYHSIQNGGKRIWGPLTMTCNVDEFLRSFPNARERIDESAQVYDILLCRGIEKQLLDGIIHCKNSQ